MAPNLIFPKKMEVYKQGVLEEVKTRLREGPNGFAFPTDEQIRAAITSALKTQILSVTNLKPSELTRVVATATTWVLRNDGVI